MKKVLIILVVVSLLLVGCGSSKKSFKIGINQLVEHPALDAVRDGFIQELKDQGIDVDIVVKNAQGEVSAASTIAGNFLDDKVDLIFAIATPAAQSTVNMTQDTPIVFSAVTDPVTAKLVDNPEKPGGNVTGTSDGVDIEQQLALFKELDPNIKNVGILFNTSEANSEIQVTQAKEAAAKLDLTIVEVGISSINDASQALETLLPKVDAMYLITDNSLASAIKLVTDRLVQEKKISVAAEGALVEGGALISNGISYFELGRLSGKMAKEILVDGKKPGDIPVGKPPQDQVTVNETTLEALGLDKNMDIFKNAEFVK